MLWKKIKANPLFQGSFFLLAATSFSNFLNYFYHLLAGRYLPADQYGLLESLIVLNYFLAVIITSFGLAVVNQINRTSKNQLSAVICTIQRLALKLTLILWLFFLLLLKPLSLFLNITEPLFILIFSLQLLFSFIPALYQAILQAKLKFASLALTGAGASLAKVLLATGLLILGWQTSGAIASLTISSIAATGLSYFFIRRGLPRLKLNLKPTRLPSAFWQFSSLAIITQLSLTSLYSSDILLSRHFLAPDLSGIYSAMAVSGKIIFFVTTAVIIVAYPLFSQQKQSLNKLRTTFLQSLALILSLTLIGFTAYQLFPRLIISLLYRHNFSLSAQHLPQYALFISLYTLLYLLIQFLLALGKTSAALIPSVCALLQILLISQNHLSIPSIITQSIYAAALGLLLASISVIKQLYAKR